MKTHFSQSANRRRFFPFFKIAVMIILSGCTNQPTVVATDQSESIDSNGDKLMVVDCLLPGRMRKLGQSFTYLTPRKPIKTTAVNCEIRGGEYTAYDRGSYVTALKIWLPKAKEGDPEAQTYVGEIYEKGLGIAPDYQLAASWYRKAADQGYSRAQINLGYLYEKGLGVNQDLVGALNLYRQASGLQDDNIAFASTIEAAVRSEYEGEIQLLRNELSNTTQQIKRLSSQFKQSQNQLSNNRKKLSQAQRELARTRKKLEELKSSETQPGVQQEILFQQERLQEQEKSVAARLAELKRLKNQQKEQNNKITTKLEIAESRTQKLNQELEQAKKTLGEDSDRLAITTTQLASTESILKDLTDRHSEEKQRILKEKQIIEERQHGILEETKKQFDSVSSQLQQQNKEISKLQQKLATTESEKKQLTDEKLKLEQQNVSSQNRKLMDLARQLAIRDQELGKQQQKIRQLNTEKTTLLSEKKALQNKSLSKQDADLETLIQQYDRREKELARQQDRIGSLEIQKTKYQAQLEKLSLSKASVQGLSRPSIEIIEPPFKLTRSKPTAVLRSAMSHRDVTGKVIAKLGLLSFDVNGVSTPVNDAGLFKSKVQLTGKETLVRSVAIDQVGNKAELEFLLIAAEALKARPTAGFDTDRKLPDVNFGTYHALLIGNNIYDFLPTLKTPINDVRSIGKVLQTRYGFKTTVLSNAKRYEVLSALNDMRKELSEKDNLLVYYAGHGELDRVNLRGHWLPTDAEAGNTANWISTVAITDILNTMSAKHILVVADSCYSGALTRSSLARIEPGVSDEKRKEWLTAMAKTKSRTVLTSGGMKPVLDGGGGDHSLFANIFIKALESNNAVLEGQALYRSITKDMRVATRKINFEQTPQYAPIQHAGHESGEFFFIPQGVARLSLLNPDSMFAF